jgi:hypothetical protein
VTNVPSSTNSNAPTEVVNTAENTPAKSDSTASADNAATLPIENNTDPNNPTIVAPDGEIPNIFQRFYLSASLGPQWAVRDRETEGVHDEVYATSSYFDANEDMSTTFSPTFSLGFDLNERFAIQTGFGFYSTSLTTQHDVEYWYEDEEYFEIDDIDFVTSSGTVFLAGQDYLPYDAEDEDEYLFNISGTEEIHYLYVPLDVRYTFLDKKVKLYAQTGISLHVLLNEHTELDVLNEANERFTTEVNSIEGLAGDNLGYQLAIGVQVPIGKHFSVMLEPQLRQNFSYITHTEMIETKQSMFLINGGLSFHF